MPADLLFDYDQYVLRPQAISSLEKLALLFKRNPHALFRIEGHADSFGEESYNQVLSEMRARSVKMWLVNNAGLDPSRIRTRGYGETRLVVPGTGTEEEQALNRRVEILIRTRKLED